MFHKFSCVPPKGKKLEPLGAKGACRLTSLSARNIFVYLCSLIDAYDDDEEEEDGSDVDDFTERKYYLIFM
jgi:hypothetical protein